MQDRDDSPLFTAAALLVLAGLVVLQFILAGREQERSDARMQKIEPPPAEAPRSEKPAETPPVVVDGWKDETRRLQPDYTRMDATHEMPTAAQRAAAEAFYKKYLDPDPSKVVSRQMPQDTRGNTMQGFNMNKWVYFGDDGATATLVGMGEAYVNIRPEDMNAMNYTYYNQGRLGTLIVVNFRTGDDRVFAQCKESFAEGFPPQKLLTVFGYGVAERVMHDGLNDEVILNVSPLTSCALGDNYQ
ncbi:MAG: hypothetical protein EPN97_11895 [Alphaproteobacteria bacterium]|nr:MAG: hypothetical protein EPN97_11895 [Alphaproteobacteria bacterium]